MVSRCGHTQEAFSIVPGTAFTKMMRAAPGGPPNCCGIRLKGGDISCLKDSLKKEEEENQHCGLQQPSSFSSNPLGQGSSPLAASWNRLGSSEISRGPGPNPDHFHLSLGEGWGGGLRGIGIFFHAPPSDSSVQASWRNRAFGSALGSNAEVDLGSSNSFLRLGLAAGGFGQALRRNQPVEDVCVRAIWRPAYPEAQLGAGGSPGPRRQPHVRPLRPVWLSTETASRPRRPPRGPPRPQSCALRKGYLTLALADQPHSPCSPRDLPGHSPSAPDRDGLPLQQEHRGGGGAPETRRAVQGRGAKSGGWPRGYGRQRDLLEGWRLGAEELRCFALDSRALTSFRELPLASETRGEPCPEQLQGEEGEGNPRLRDAGFRSQLHLALLWSCEGSQPW
ncbi:uncharacterized protein LOC129547351 [Moschus berezovskii]|uniref:uncharacterized protein LOC129547351 n=1 Tax=Moschus berezovskii TaxID=68408 RepID=UPI002443AFC9|nr:uncharacterized protein LOC129547351 [Moschus berezovskii]